MAFALIAFAAGAGATTTTPVRGARPAVRRVAASRPAAADSTHANGRGPRTLDDIHIEGEIPVPQVLFITARDQRRFMEFQHRRYLKTSRMVGEDTVLPSRIVVTGVRPAPDKEASR